MGMTTPAATPPTSRAQPEQLGQSASGADREAGPPTGPDQVRGGTGEVAALAEHDMTNTALTGETDDIDVGEQIIPRSYGRSR